MKPQGPQIVPKAERVLVEITKSVSTGRTRKPAPLTANRRRFHHRLEGEVLTIKI